MKLRKQQIKNFCCLLFLANGTPMFRAGDEFLQTQSGNNNPYNQDNAMSWLTRPSQQEGREHQSVTSPNRFATKRGLALLLGAALAIAVIWIYWPRKEATPGILEASGRVEGDQAAVGAKIGGRIVGLPIREGDNLKTGDFIAELSSEQTKAQLEQAHHDLHTAREEGDQAEARISVSEREVKARETAVQLAEQESTARIGEAEVNLQTARLPRGQSPSGPHRQPPQLDFSGGAYGRYSLGVSLP